MSDTWPIIERWLLGSNRLVDSDGLETSIQPTWSVSPGVALVAVLVAALLLLVIYWHESATAGRVSKVALASIRTALVAVIAFMFYGWTIQRHRTELSDVVVVLDD